MDESAMIAIRELITKAVNECMDPEILDLIYKLLCFL